MRTGRLRTQFTKPFFKKNIKMFGGLKKSCTFVAGFNIIMTMKAIQNLSILRLVDVIVILRLVA